LHLQLPERFTANMSEAEGAAPSNTADTSSSSAPTKSSSAAPVETTAPSSGSSSSSSNPDGVVKTVFLIRHAESLENQRIASMFNCLGDLGRFSLPKKSDVGASFELFNISANADAPISALGLQQCEVMKTTVSEQQFLTTHQIQLVAHSPLERAKQTCAELFGCRSVTVVGGREGNDNTKKEEQHQHEDEEVIDFSAAEEKVLKETGSDAAATKEERLPEPVQRVVSLALLSEKTPIEWLPGNSGSFEQRVLEFERWLSQQPESTVCIVGHSQFFKFLLGLPFKFENCDIYQVSFDLTKTKPNEAIILEHDGTADSCTLNTRWYDLKKLYSCKQQQQNNAASTASSSSSSSSSEAAPTKSNNNEDSVSSL
jgi:broad specificity phosphatase PhoE